jgi:hypothetical protein
VLLQLPALRLLTTFYFPLRKNIFDIVRLKSPCAGLRIRVISGFPNARGWTMNHLSDCLDHPTPDQTALGASRSSKLPHPGQHDHSMLSLGNQIRVRRAQPLPGSRLYLRVPAAAHGSDSRWHWPSCLDCPSVSD